MNTAEGRYHVNALEKIRHGFGLRSNSLRGFMDGGFTGGSLGSFVPNVPSIARTTDLSDESIDKVRVAVREGATEGSDSGTSKGLAAAVERRTLLDQLEVDRNV